LGIKALHDTADMAAFFKSFRNLASAAKNFLGKTLEKETRNAMKGKKWSEVEHTDLGRRLIDYALSDAVTTLEVGMKLLPHWPLQEQKASRISREAGWRGMPLDLEYLKCCHDHLQELVFGYLKSIPWYPDEKPLSAKAVREQARKVGIWCPASLDKRDPKAQEWEKEFAQQYPWVAAIRNYRRANTLFNRVKSLWDGREGGVFPFELLYFGADTTGRWSGGGIVVRSRWARGTEEVAGKFNMQNMPRDPMFGVDLRYCLKAPEGKAFYIKDYGQIENRALLWRVGDKAALDLIRSGVHPYKAFAVLHLGAGEGLSTSDPIYMTAKACVLGCGYQAGATAFQRAAKVLAGLNIDNDRSVELVRLFRATNPKVVEHWRRHQTNLLLSANHGDPTHEVQLGSGRWLTYYNPKVVGQDSYGRPNIVAQYTMDSEPEKIYGGLLTENEIQATARDVLRDAWIAQVEAGMDVPLTVHDELVAIGPLKDGKPDPEFNAEMESLALTSSPWAKGLPLSIKTVITEHYEK